MKFIQTFFLICLSQLCVAQDQKSYTICSQNLYRYGEKSSINSPQGRKQRDFLATRIKNAGCSVIAFQELIGKNSRQAMSILESLSEQIERSTGKDFEPIISKSNDSFIRNAFLISNDDFSIIETENWNHHILPQFDYRGSPRGHVRGPLYVKLKPRTATEMELLIVTDHLKSKTRSWKDPTNTQFEMGRVSSAAEIKEQLVKLKTNNAVEIFLGDRNTGVSSATAQVLSGRLLFNDFKRGGACEISAYGSPLCKKESFRKPDFIPVIETLGHQSRREISTFKTYSPEILDEIYVFEEDVGYIRNRYDQISAGVEGEFKKGSDHLLVWIKVYL